MNLIRLTEKTRVKVLKSLPMTESTSLIESNDGAKHTSRGAYTVEVSRYNHENLNGRVYTKKLWENVINAQRETWDGSVGLLDHPSDEARQTDVFCVYHNMRLNESNDTVLCDLYLVGRHGQDVKERIDAGGYIELSSSGLGEINSGDGKTVVEETFRIERPGDLVFDASQQVRFDNTNEITQESRQTESKVETNSVEKGLLKNKTMIKEDKQMSLEEKNFKLSMSRFITEAKDLSNVSEKIDRFEELLSFCDGASYEQPIMESISSELELAKKEIGATVEKAGQLEKEVVDLTEGKISFESKITELEGLLEDTKLSATKFKELYENEKAKVNTLPTVEEFKALEVKLSESTKVKAPAQLKGRSLREKRQERTSLKAKLVESKKAPILKAKIVEAKLVESKPTILKAKLVEKKQPAQHKETLKKYFESKKTIEGSNTKYFKNAKKIDAKDSKEAVKDLYERWLAQEPEIVSISKDILKCRTIKEAQMTRIKLKHKIVEGIVSETKEVEKLDESVEVKDEETFGTRVMSKASSSFAL